MTLIDQLSSVLGEKTQEGNRNVADQCLENPALLREIAAALQGSPAPVQADCAEVLTKVAEVRPDLVVPYAGELVPLLTHKTTRVRWESMHALALIATYVPEVIEPQLSHLGEMIRHDKSTIVRDYAVEALGHYAKSGEAAALQAHPLLRESLTVWAGKHRGRALNALVHVVASAPSLALDLRLLAEDYLHDNRGVAKKAAKELVKVIDRLH